jgi:hypothetical protein
MGVFNHMSMSMIHIAPLTADAEICLPNGKETVMTLVLDYGFNTFVSRKDK